MITTVHLYRKKQNRVTVDAWLLNKSSQAT